jgi:23S rRNA-/tRNA-specific pseudouridylate synthase
MHEAASAVKESPCILGQEQGVFAVYKPSGWVVHPAGEDDVPDLISWLTDQGEGALPVHRLDRSTSGVVLCSPDAAVRARLGQWFAERLIEKRYLALVHGELNRKGVIRDPLRDTRRGRKVEAVTRYQCLEQLEGFSLLELHPETGRKHQIRRHLQGLGHPIVGDRRYGPSDFQRIPGSPERLWLHAQAVRLPTGLSFEAPLPDVLERHRDLMRNPISAD